MGKVKLSESLMASAFEECLREPAWFSQLPQFTSIVREVVCQQGVADFIALADLKLTRHSLQDITSTPGANGTGSIRILSLLKPVAPRTEKYIVRSTGYSAQTVRHLLSILKDRKLIKQNTKGRYVLSKKARVPQVDLWAFELKMRDWKRAFFQALQCKAFASYVMTVFPMERMALLSRHLEKFRKMGVGVMLFDPVDKSYDILVRPLKSSPSSRMHYLYVFSKVISPNP